MSGVYYGSLKKYGSKYKLACMDMERGYVEYDNREPMSERGSVNSRKLENNIARARSKVMEYTLCNDFDFFITLTIDAEKHDRYDLNGFVRVFGQWLYNYSRRKLSNGERIKYLLLPEQHKNRAWHLHGLIMGLPESHLTDFEQRKHPRHLICKGYRNWQAYEEKFGFCSLSAINSQEAVSRYMTKYITKDFASMTETLNGKLYYCSKGLATSQLVYRNFITYNGNFDFENDYCKIKWFNNESELSAIEEIGENASFEEAPDAPDWDDEEQTEIPRGN